MESNAPAITARSPLGRTARLRPAALVPNTSALGPRTRWLVRAGFALLAAAAAIDFLHVVFGLAPSWETALHGPIMAGVNVIAALIICVRAAVERERRSVWLCLAVGFCAYAIGTVLWDCWLQFLPHPPNPSVADGFWIAMYPLSALALLVSGSWYSSRGVPVHIWLDGIVAATATAALGASFIVPPLVHAAGKDHTAVVTDLIYPLADMIVGILIVALLSIRGWRIDRKWVLLLATFVFWFGGDCCWALQIGDGAITGSSLATLMYMAAFICVAASAWQPEVHPVVTDRTNWAALCAPAVLTLVAPVILLYDHFTRISLVALIITWIALLVSMMRFSLGLRDTLSFRDVQRAALTDELTGLPNRRMFLTKLRTELESAEQGRRTLSALMIDLDNFKQLNDTLGHDAGDELLRLIGPRLLHALTGQATLARLGGDEFAILLEPGASRQAAGDAAQAVLNSFREPFRVHGLVLRLTASVGIATYPCDAASPEQLLKCADVAMYDAKRSRHGFEHYSSDRDDYTRERLELSGEIAIALERGEIEAVFQPIVDTDSRRIFGAEALVRWRRQDGTVRPPSEFLEAAEIAGLSRPLTRRVMSLALNQVSEWRNAGHQLYVTVNATVADLLDESFPDEVADALAAHRLDEGSLKIEVTESSIVANPERISAVLHRLRAMGVGVALDDFGTGYSSLTHLRELPVDAVKIDRSFVTQMCDDTTDAAIVYAIIELAHRLNLKVVAEGVEDEQVWKELQRIGCQRVQGYAFSKPIEPTEFTALLETLRSAHLAESQSVPTPASTASRGSIV